MKRRVLLLLAILMLTVTSITYANFGDTIYCQICNTPMHWNGGTYVEWGKMFHVYECLNGHQALVRP